MRIFSMGSMMFYLIRWVIWIPVMVSKVTKKADLKLPPTAIYSFMADFQATAYGGVSLLLSASGGNYDDDLLVSNLLPSPVAV